MKIGVLTGGGDVPGLNLAIKSLTMATTKAGHEVVGIRRGWRGLVAASAERGADNSAHMRPLSIEDVRHIDRTGGTVLHSSRTNPSKMREKEMPEHLKSEGMEYPADVTPHVLAVLEAMEIDALVAIGGDDTLSYAARLDREGFPTVAIPKTMDNDVNGTDYCIGFSTALTRTVQFVHDLRTSTGSHERIAVIELFGRNAGWTALFSAFLSGSDRCVIPEVPFDINRLAELLVEDKANNPSNYAVLLVSEGAVMEGGEIIESGEPDAYGHKKLGGIGDITASELKRITGQNMLIQPVRYLMRCGSPDSLDRMVGTTFGNMAFDLIMKKDTGKMVAVVNGVYSAVPAQMAVAGVKPLDLERLYFAERYRPNFRNLMGMPLFLSSSPEIG